TGTLPWTRIDDLHRMILDELLAKRGITGLSEEETAHLNRAWHRLDPWPDAVEGLARLKRNFIIGTLSNGDMGLLLNIATRSGLPAVGWGALGGAGAALQARSRGLSQAAGCAGARVQRGDAGGSAPRRPRRRGDAGSQDRLRAPPARMGAERQDARCVGPPV